MRRIFLSYRRADSSAYTGRLFDQLALHFGNDSVFMDVTSIKSGFNAVEVINDTVASCAVMVVVIGKSWLAHLHKREKSRRLDHLQLEIATALHQSVDIIPVLVGRADMPHEEDLPHELREFGSRQAFEITDNHFRDDVKLLIDRIEDLLAKAPIKGFLPVSDAAPASLSVVGVEEVLSWGWDGKQLLETLFAIDRETVEGLDPDYSGTVEQWVPIVMNHPYTWRLIVDKPGSIVGNWHFISLVESEIRRALNGVLRERDITEDKVRYMDMSGWYDIYFLAVFLLPRYRRIENLVFLRKSILDHFTELARKGVFINRICANAYSPSGEAFCKSFNLKPGKKHVDHGRIYWRTFYPLPALPIFDGYRELGDLYERAVKDKR